MWIDRQEKCGEASPAEQRYSRDSKRRKRCIYMQMVPALMLAFAAHCAFAGSDVNDVSDKDQQQAALRTLIGKNPAPADSVKGLALAQWTHGPSSAGPLWVVAALVQRPSDDVDAQLWTGVLNRDGQGFHLLASDRSERVDTSPMLWNASLTMDLVPYRISDQETAFGVRFDNNYTSTSHSDTTEILSLYRYADGRVTPVFTALTDWSTYDKDEAGDCVTKKAGKGREPSDAQQSACDAENTTEVHYVLSFSPHTTNGYHDLLVRPRGKAASGKPARFTWKDGTYQPRRFAGDGH
ncbi:hypothetical protein [Burkholderia stabilis]|uniref:hypothetical protein n=1 Tax=Burkholderia stabilis TaxID=95485 RepID=UPI00158DDC6B|nr:hypothetical protein [Burkholderia stabilis]